MIRFFLILRKIVLALAPLAFLYLLRKKKEKSTKSKSPLPGFDPLTELRMGKSKIVEGKIVKETKKKNG